MILTERVVTIRKGVSTINAPIYLYRGDYEIEVRFVILNSKFIFRSTTNFIETNNACFGQLAILKPDGDNIFSNIVPCVDGTVSFVITKTMADELSEIGEYSFHIRLYNENQVSRVSIPPVQNGIVITEPIASEDHTNIVGEAITGYALANTGWVDDSAVEPFDEEGNYNQKEWVIGDKITTGAMNKIESAINTIHTNTNVTELNNRMISNYNVLDTKITMLDEKDKELSEQLVDIESQTLCNIISLLGVKNDGSEDISSKLLDYAQDKENLYLYFPKGVYKWENSISLANSKIKFVGDNAEIHHYNRGAALKIGDVTTHSVDKFFLEGIDFINKRAKSAIDISGATSLIINDAKRVSILNCDFLHAEQYGIQLRSKNGIIENCIIDNVVVNDCSSSITTTSSIALETCASGGDGYINNLKISNCHFEVKDTYIDNNGDTVETTLSNACKLQACNNVEIVNTTFVGGKENGTLSFIYDTRKVKMTNVNCISDSLISNAISISGCPNLELMATNCVLSSDNFSQSFGTNGGFKLINLENCIVGRFTKVSGEPNNIVFSNCGFYTPKGMSLPFKDSILNNCYFLNDSPIKNMVILEGANNIKINNVNNVDILEINSNSIIVDGGSYKQIAGKKNSNNVIIKNSTIKNSNYCIRIYDNTVANWNIDSCNIFKEEGDNRIDQLIIAQGENIHFSNNIFTLIDKSNPITYPAYFKNSTNCRFIESENVFNINKTADYMVKAENSTNFIKYKIGDIVKIGDTLKVWQGDSFLDL